MRLKSYATPLGAANAGQSETQLRGATIKFDYVPFCMRMRIGTQEFNWGERTYVMGVLNVTPDSFSGDGTLAGDAGLHRSVDQALRMEDDGADIIDVGGESTRPPAVYPDAKPVPEQDELERVIPVIQELKNRLSCPLSIDTRKAVVAAEAVGAGAAMANDVSMLADPDMASTVARIRVPIVISHIRAKAEYDDVVTDVVSDLSEAITRAEHEGLSRDQVIADPGIGFAKKFSHSLEVMRRLPELKSALALPLLLGTSRKSFIGAVLGTEAHERVEGTAATVSLSVAGGADIVRVHDVKEMVRVARMSDAIVRGWKG